MKQFVTKDISFLLNGEKVVLNNVNPKDLLVDYLRSPKVNLTGTKLSCGEGGCGACTVLWSRFNEDTQKIEEIPINSCLRPLCSLDGTAITTIEGISDNDCGHLIENNMVANCASQCGYCSPGFVMTMYGLLKKNIAPGVQDVEDQFAGNICRCTGYISILNAMRVSADNAKVSIAANSAFYSIPIKPPANMVNCSFEVRDGADVWFHPVDINQVLYLMDQFGPVGVRAKIVQGNTSIGIYKADVENPSVFIDVSGLPMWKKISRTESGIQIAGGVTIAELLNYLSETFSETKDLSYSGLRVLHDHIKMIAGVQVRNAASVSGSLMMVKNHEDSPNPFPGDLFTVLTALGAIVHFTKITGETSASLLGQLPSAEEFRKGIIITSIDIPFNEPGETIYSYRVARRAQNSHPIVNAAFKCSFNDDDKLAGLTVVYGGIGYSAINLKNDSEKLCRKKWNWNEKFLDAALKLFRHSLENTNQSSTPGISCEYKIDLALGLFIKFFAFVAEKLGLKVPLTYFSALDNKRPIAEGSHNFLESPFYDPQLKVITKKPAFALTMKPVEKPINISTSAFLAAVPIPQAIAMPAKEAVVGESVPVKLDAPSQVNGTVKYTHDLQPLAGTLEGYYVYSEYRNAIFSYSAPLNEIHEELSLLFPGSHYITHSDIINPSPNIDTFNSSSLSTYDPIFSDGNITCYGQPIGIVVAEDLKTAKSAAEFLQKKIVYNKSAIDTIENLAVAKSKDTKLLPLKGMEEIFRPIPQDTFNRQELIDWMNKPKPVDNGSDEVFLQGSQSTGAQYHFYMEPQGAYVIPTYDHQIEVYSSTQNHASVQKRVANALKLPGANVKVATTRLGGGYGGKELRQVYVAAAAAVAAFKLQRPVRLLLDRNIDMRTMGTRHPYDGEYAVLAQRDGLIKRMRVDYASDAGNSYDCSYPVMDLSLLCAENAYDIPVFKTTGAVYRTNTKSRTAFRSFGLIQSMLITESAIEQLAFQLQKLPEDIRKMNFYADNITGVNPPRTPYGSPFVYGRINQVWDKFREKIDFDKRVNEVQKFNKESRWKKRGISMIPLKYGISYTYRPMNQGSAYIIAYQFDGSIILYHGGVEMGQGLNTKMMQVAAKELNIDISRIRIGPTSSALIPNASSTGASTGSDLNGGAVQMACRILKQKLISFIKGVKKHPGKYPDTTEVQRIFLKEIDINNYDDWNSKWPTLISYAVAARIDVSAQFSYASPQLGQLVLDPITKNNQISPDDSQVFFYYNNCVAASEVEIDVLTGHYEIIQSDIVYDAGDSLNDNIDVGQIEGGFMQGVGCLTTEEMLYGPCGEVVSDGTWEYKPPCSKTIPQKFNVYLLKYVAVDDPHAPLKDTYGINSSKSTGEPPLVLSNTVFFAIKHAIAEARRDNGVVDWFTLDAPATVEKIKLACNVKLTS